MSTHCGIVGLSDVGKSILFNALTAAMAAAENYPFCTTDPNVGSATSPDERLTARARMLKPKQGDLRQKGKEYVVRDGDVIHFRFNV